MDFFRISSICLIWNLVSPTGLSLPPPPVMGARWALTVLGAAQCYLPHTGLLMPGECSQKAKVPGGR
jgi:hypothetical protein